MIPASQRAQNLHGRRKEQGPRNTARPLQYSETRIGSVDASDLDQVVGEGQRAAQASDEIEFTDPFGGSKRRPYVSRSLPDHHVVMQPDGMARTPNGLTAGYRTFLNAHGLKRIRLHDLRHTHATHLLQSGIHPKIASERLGHSKIGITLDLYSHVLPGMQNEAASKIDALLSDALQRQQNKKG